MYAVVETGGKQYKVAVGDKLKVEKIEAEAGSSIDFDRVLMIADGDQVTVGSPLVETSVTGTVLSHGKNKKIRVFKMKRRKNYRRTQGHRQFFTEVEITGIGGQKAAAKTESKSDSKSKVENKAVAASVDDPTGGDLLTTINGIGPVIEKKLHGLGITTFQQIADLDQARIDEINDQLSFKGRIEREEWVEQAKTLISS
ncbi:MAG: 50S ribosomal protein L21 [Gammaproteobacteria bacterium]|nr:50S ribosomal protein L21 [Gammaproteobacteria bacterium]